MVASPRGLQGESHYPPEELCCSLQFVKHHMNEPEGLEVLEECSVDGCDQVRTF